MQAAGAPQAGDVALPGRALLPGTVNSHCHTFQSLLRGLGDDLDFMGWRDRVLYPFSERLDREGIALGATFAFVEMLKQGVTTCVDFFYLQDDGNDNAEAVIAGRARGWASGWSWRGPCTTGTARPSGIARRRPTPRAACASSSPRIVTTTPSRSSRRPTAPTAPRRP